MGPILSLTEAWSQRGIIIVIIIIIIIIFISIFTYIEDITRWREDMNVMFEWQEQYLTSERSERVRYCSCHENIKFISSS